MKSHSYRMVMITAMVLCVVVVGYYMATSGNVGPVIAQVGPDTPAAPAGGAGSVPLPPSTAPSSTITPPGAPPATGPASRPSGAFDSTVGGAPSSDPRGVPPRSPWDEPPKPATPTAGGGNIDGGKTHTVKSGDTFQSIAMQYLGSENKWKDIAEANPKVDPTKLKIGQVLRVPEPKAAVAKPVPVDHGTTTAGDRTGGDRTAVAGDDRAPAAGKTHKVKQGDTLSSISKQYYGTTAHWKLIYTANKAKIGDDPDRLPDGAELTIPPAPAKKGN